LERGDRLLEDARPRTRLAALAPRAGGELGEHCVTGLHGLGVRIGEAVREFLLQPVQGQGREQGARDLREREGAAVRDGRVAVLVLRTEELEVEHPVLEIGLHPRLAFTSSHDVLLGSVRFGTVPVRFRSRLDHNDPTTEYYMRWWAGDNAQLAWHVCAGCMALQPRSYVLCLI